jgi:SAM-dependent methyltransferase
VPADHYAASGSRWALGAELVYRPIAAALVATSPHRLTGRTVLDAGAGTGAASDALRRCAAQVLAMDLSPAMLAWHAAERPPSAAADIHALPLPGPAHGPRHPRPGGAILAAVFANGSRNEARDRIDAAAHAAGWRAPAWYREMKATAIAILGTTDAMAAAAQSAGLASVHAEKRQVDVGVTEPAQLVRYRLGNPTFAAWLDAIGPERAATFATDAENAVGKPMAPYCPSVVFLRALASTRPDPQPRAPHHPACHSGQAVVECWPRPPGPPDGS